MPRAVPAARAVTALLLLGGCGGGSPAAMSAVAGRAGATAHVFVAVLENQSYETVIGSAAMPYFNALIARYGLAMGYYANTHPSLGNYFMMTTGNIVTTDDGFQGIVSDDNVARILTAAGLSWKVYAQGLPSVGYLGPDAYPYERRHNPFAYFSDVVRDPNLARNLVPVEQLAADVSAEVLPNYGFMVPDFQNDGHDCPAARPGCTNDEKLAAADRWLAATVAPLIASRSFQDSGLLIITFDEADFSDERNGGGHIATVVVSARTPARSTSSMLYQHQSLLATTLAALGVDHAPGAAAAAPIMSDLFPP